MGIVRFKGQSVVAKVTLGEGFVRLSAVMHSSIARACTVRNDNDHLV